MLDVGCWMLDAGSVIVLNKKEVKWGIKNWKSGSYQGRL